jgi:hypothetical protein
MIEYGIFMHYVFVYLWVNIGRIGEGLCLGIERMLWIVLMFLMFLM